MSQRKPAQTRNDVALRCGAAMRHRERALKRRAAATDAREREREEKAIAAIDAELGALAADLAAIESTELHGTMPAGVPLSEGKPGGRFRL